MESLLTILIIILLLANFLAILFLIKRKHPDPVNNEQLFKDELSSLKNTFSQSFGSMSKEIAKDMTGALTKVDEKVSVFNQQVSELNKSQDNFSRILSGVKSYGTLAEFGLGALLKDLLPSSQYIANAKMKEDLSFTIGDSNVSLLKIVPIPPDKTAFFLFPSFILISSIDDILPP